MHFKVDEAILCRFIYFDRPFTTRANSAVRSSGAIVQFASVVRTFAIMFVGGANAFMGIVAAGRAVRGAARGIFAILGAVATESAMLSVTTVSVSTKASVGRAVLSVATAGVAWLGVALAERAGLNVRTA